MKTTGEIGFGDLIHIWDQYFMLVGLGIYLGKKNYRNSAAEDYNWHPAVASYMKQLSLTHHEVLMDGFVYHFPVVYFTPMDVAAQVPVQIVEYNQ